MKNRTLRSIIINWIFYFISVGMLVAGGIYIEKIILTNAAMLDILRALLFCLVGAGISAYSFFGKSGRCENTSKQR